MYHGSIKHGGQLLDAGLRNAPSSYFGPTSGYGRVFASLPEMPRRVGVIGLGAGAIAAYARKGDVFRFYEIDPQVAAVAMMEFSFLKDSPAQMEVALGDGRLVGPQLQQQRIDRSRPATNGPHYDRYGLGIGMLDGWLGHTGNGIGFTAATFYDPGTKGTIAVLVNATASAKAPPDLNFAEEIFLALADVVATR